MYIVYILNNWNILSHTYIYIPIRIRSQVCSYLVRQMHVLANRALKFEFRLLSINLHSHVATGVVNEKTRSATMKSLGKRWDSWCIEGQHRVARYFYWMDKRLEGKTAYKTLLIVAKPLTIIFTYLHKFAAWLSGIVDAV